MNNKFFADKNDFFKYDLLLELMENSPFLTQLTFIPMLTPADGRKGGGLKNYSPGNRRMDLYEFLSKHLKSRRDIHELRQFFSRKPFQYTPYRDSTFFSNKTRDEYFAAIPKTALRDALIFFDPDNGLTDSPGTTDDKHLTYDELEGVYRRAENPSMLLVYYHLPRVPRETLFRRINKRLDQFRPRPKAAFVHNNRIAFVGLTKESRVHEHVETILSNYAARIPVEPGAWSPAL